MLKLSLKCKLRTAQLKDHIRLACSVALRTEVSAWNVSGRRRDETEQDPDVRTVVECIRVLFDRKCVVLHSKNVVLRQLPHLPDENAIVLTRHSAYISWLIRACIEF